MDTLAFFGVLIGGIIAALGSWWVAKIGASTSRDTSAWGRLAAVEKSVEELRKQVDESNTMLRLAATFIDRLGVWIERGMSDRMPQPPTQLLTLITASLWLSQEREKNEKNDEEGDEEL